MTDVTRWSELFLRRQTVMREAPGLLDDPDGHHAAIQEAIELEHAMHDLFARTSSVQKPPSHGGSCTHRR